MRVLHIVNHEGPAGLEVTDAEEPTELQDMFAGIDEPVRIQVRAAAVSFPELLQCWGKYQHQPPMPFVPGSEVAGTVISAPAGSRYAPGDRVAAFTHVGGIAEVALAPEFLTFPLHNELSFAQGAALVANYHTAYFALVTRAQYVAGERVLVQGAAGGVGTATVQIARGLGAEVVAVVSHERKAEVARAAGADHVVLSTGPWKDDALTLCPGGVDVVIDPVGGDRTIDNLRVLRESGRLVVVGFAGGGIPEIKGNRLLLKNISAVGAGWGAYAFSKPEYVREVEKQLDVLIAAGSVAPVVGAVFPLEKAADAFAHIDARAGVGKVVVEVGA
jgi:NADPH2:quinone reductase